ncbi:MAG: DUF2203 domain-containing protein [Actinomycetota bacterium]
MDGPGKYTQQSANELLPLVRERLAELQGAYAVLQKLNAEVKRTSETNGGSGRGSDWKEATEKLAVLLEWFNERDIIVRDVAQGLIDFPAILNGEEVVLCWKAPEPAVEFWHYPDAGFAGRQPL